MPIEKFGWNKQSLVGLFWHQGIGGLSFLFDILIIFLLLTFLDMHYTWAVTIGFICATFFNYTLVRSTIYANTSRSHRVAVIYFFTVATVAMILTVTGTVFFYEVVQLPLYISRVLVGFALGLTGYVVDCLFVFRLR